jgi:hypothetical protein
MSLLRHCLYSPPGKILRLLAHHLLDTQVAHFTDKAVSSTVVPIQVKKSEDIPFTPLEEMAEVRAKTSCPDDAEIDLYTWALPNKTPQRLLQLAAFFDALRLSGGRTTKPRRR